MAWSDTVVRIKIPSKKEIRLSDLENPVLLMITAVTELRKKRIIVDARPSATANTLVTNQVNEDLEVISKQLSKLQNYVTNNQRVSQ